MCKLFFESAATAINYDSLSLWIISKDFFTNHYDILSLQKLNNKLNEEFQLLLWLKCKKTMMKQIWLSDIIVKNARI